MHMSSRLSIVAVLLCSSLGAYAETYSEMRDDLVMIRLIYNKNLSYDKLRELTILRAARLAQSRGFTHFEFVYTADRPVTGSVERYGNVVKDIYGNASVTENPGSLVPTTIRPNAMILIKLCNENNAKCGGLSAHDTLRDIHE